MLTTSRYPLQFFNSTLPHLKKNQKLLNSRKKICFLRYLQKSVILFSFPQDKQELQGYIHNVSLVQTIDGTKFFNCQVQLEDQTVRAISFTPEKKTTLQSADENRSPVKISNFRHSRYLGNESIVIDKKTSVVQLVIDIGFERTQMIDTSQLITIKDLQQVVPEQNVNLKAKVTRLSGVKKVPRGNHHLTKQECFITDPTGSIKLILWESQVATLENNVTYLFNNIKLKLFNNERYLNPPKSQPYLITETSPYTESLPNVEDVQPLTRVETKAEIIGVTQINKYDSCYKCTKKVSEKDSMPFCSHCKLSLKRKKVKVQWFMRVLVEEITTNKSIHLTVYNEIAEF